MLGALSSSLFAETSMDKLLANQIILTSGGNTGGGGGGLLSTNSTSISTSTLSVCDVYACVVLQNDPSAASELRSFFTSSSSHHASQTGDKHVVMYCNIYQRSMKWLHTLSDHCVPFFLLSKVNLSPLFYPIFSQFQLKS